MNNSSSSSSSKNMLDIIKDTNNNNNNVNRWYEVNDDEKEQSATDLNILIHATDKFNGIRINGDNLPSTKSEFSSKLLYSLSKWRNNNKRGIFLKLPISKASYLEIALCAGFSIHHARPKYIMLINWLPKNELNMIPDYCHTYISVGCLVINKLKQGIVIQEIWNHGRKEWWKLPGGAIDRLENINIAAIRETKEETGLNTKFKGILHFRHFYPFRFMNSGDIYFICLLKYDGDITKEGKEFNIDQNEIAEIKWMDIDDILELKTQQATFGSKEGKENIKRNVDLMIKNWDNDDGNDNDIGYTTFRPLNTRENREYYVYAPMTSKY